MNNQAQIFESGESDFDVILSGAFTILSFVYLETGVILAKGIYRYGWDWLLKL